MNFQQHSATYCGGKKEEKNQKDIVGRRTRQPEIELNASIKFQSFVFNEWLISETGRGPEERPIHQPGDETPLRARARGFLGFASLLGDLRGARPPQRCTQVSA